MAASKAQGRKVGDVCTWDFQSDDLQGQYVLVEDLGGGRWIIEHLAPSDELVDRLLDVAATAEEHGWSYLGDVDDVMREYQRRVDVAGTRMEIEFVSAARWAAAF